MAVISSKVKKISVAPVKTKVSNELIESFVKRSNLNSLKLLFYVSTLDNFVVSSDGRLHSVDVLLSDICSSCNISPDTLKKSFKSMSEMSISVTDDKSESFITVLPFVKMSYNGYIHLELFKEIIDLVYDVKRKFTIINIDDIMQLSSKHSVKMLALLEMISNFSSNIPKRKKYDLDELNLLFGLNYKRIVTFAKEILEPVKKELDLSSKYSFLYQIDYDKLDKSSVGRARAVSVTIDLVDNARVKQTNEELKYKKYLEQKKEQYTEHENQASLNIF